MMPAIGAMKGTLATKALPSFRAAREVFTTLIATSVLPPIDPDGMGSTPSAEYTQSELASDDRVEVCHHSRLECLLLAEKVSRNFFLREK